MIKVVINLFFWLFKVGFLCNSEIHSVDQDDLELTHIQRERDRDGENEFEL